VISFERDRQLGSGQILVDHGCHPAELTGVRSDHRYPAASTADHEHAGVAEGAHGLDLHQPQRPGRGHHTPPAGPVGRDGPAQARGQRLRLALVVAGSNELGGVAERRVGRIDDRLAHDANRPLGDARVSELLDQPVPDHALGLGDQHVERIRPAEAGIRLTFQREHPHLRPVAVAEHELVIGGQRGEGHGGLPDMPLLDRGVRPLAPLEQGVTSQRHDDFHDGWLRVAIRRALMVCIRFSAWSKTTEAGDSKTSSVTSRASSPRWA
jgi:hypothetical protein